MEQNNSNNPPPPQPTTSSPKTSTKCLILSLIGFIFVTSFLAGYFAFQNYQLKKQTPAIPIPSPDPTANWQIYTNPDLNLSFKYPPDWTDPQTNSLSTRTSIILKDGQQTDQLIPKLEITLGTYFNQSLQKEMTLDELINQLNLDSQTTASKKISLSDLSGYRFSYQPQNSPCFNTFIYLAQPDQPANILIFTYRHHQSSENSSALPLTLSQILSTLKFTPQTITITGIIRTSGLSLEEKQKLNLTKVNYQLTHLDNYQPNPHIYGYFLLDNQNLEPLLGKCVQITGFIPATWKNKNLTHSYNRSVLDNISIKKLDNIACHPYSQQPATYTGQKLTLNGTITYRQRTVPDINYDYQLKLEEPFIDQSSSAGSPQQTSLVVAVPNTQNVWLDLENNLNQTIEVQGYMQWGHAESKYFQITSLKNLP